MSAEQREEPISADRFLEQSLLFTIVAHAAAMIAMATLLLPGMPGGGNVTDAARIAYVAHHPWLWRLGWFPWQITALSDVILGLALLRSAFIPRLPAFLALAATLVAVAIEQPSEFRWITEGVRLAQSQDAGAYLSFEQHVFVQIGAWAATAYTVAALFWTWCFAAAGIWNRLLTWLSIATWSILAVVSVGPLLPARYRLGSNIVAAGNAIGFVLLMIWLCVITELVFRRSRPDSTTGRMAPWTHPKHGFASTLFNTIANARITRGFGEWFPPVAYASDISDVIYVNYLVDASILEPMVPWGLELQRLGTQQNFGLFTFLTYKHGHFGPRMLGPLRRLMPSPVQSNWRIHVRDPQPGITGIHFISTAISNTLPSLLARLLSEGIPMHLLASGSVTADAKGGFQLLLDPAAGSAPDAIGSFTPSREVDFHAPWNLCFKDFQEMLAYCVPQDRAMSSQPWYNRITRQEIQLGIPLDRCVPLTGNVSSKTAQTIVSGAQPICFHVSHVDFQFEHQIYDVRKD